MTAMQHVYITAHGEYTATAWLGEKAQVGLRLTIEDETALPAKGTIYTPGTNGDVVLDSGTQAGTNGTLTRTWSARLGPIGSSENADAAWQADLADDFWTFLNATKGYLYNGFRWTHVKLAPIAADGKYIAPSSIYQFTSALVGTDGSTALPPEVSIAISLRAPIIGRRGRGRIYLPGLGRTNTMATDGTVASGAQTALRDAMATLVTNLENAPGTEAYTPLVAVMSAGSATAVRPAQVRVGTHLDAQRRRQHQATESYSSVAL